MESNFRSSIDYLILKDTLELIRLYNTNPGFKRILDRVLPVSERVTYKGRLLRAYLWTIQKMTPVSPSFRKYRLEVKNLTDNDKKAEVIGTLFKTYYQEKDGYYLLGEKARQAAQDKDFSLFDGQKDRAEVERIYRLEEPQKRQAENKLFERLENQGTGDSLPADKAGGQVRGDAETVFQPAPRFTARSFTARSFTAPSFVKDLASNGQIFIRRLITRFPLAAATVFSSAVGALAGAGAMESSQGAVLGGVAGGVLPAALKAGLPGLFRNFGGAANLGRGIGLAGGGAAGARLAAGLAGGPVGVALTAASFLADEKAKKLIKWVVIGIGVTLFVVLVMIPMGLLKTTSLFGPGGVGSPSGPGAPPTPSTLALVFSGPLNCNVCPADNDQQISFDIKLTYNGTGTADVEVFGQIPDNIGLPLADGEKWSVDSAAKKFSQIISAVASKEQKTLKLTLKPEGKSDFYINHFMEAKIVSPASPPSGGDEAPSDDACGGVYSRAPYPIQSNPLHKNFGDPVCTLSQPQDKDKLYTLLQQQDPSEAAFWFWMAECEASYIANAYNGSAYDAAGAWGLYQMGRGKNGALDHGDVAWPRQTSNAVSYKNQMESNGILFKSERSYWDCAKPSFCIRNPSNPTCRSRPT